MLHIVYAESSNYCGYGQHFVVKNLETDPDAAVLLEEAIEEYFYEQDQEQLEEDEIEGSPFGCIITEEPFDEDHDSWVFYKDPSQAEFYIEVNF